MPVSIVTSLMLWSFWLAPASGFEQSHPVNVDRAVMVAPVTSIWSWPATEPCTWTFLDADTEEEESDDGDPEGLASEAPWLSLPLYCQGQASPIQQDRGTVPNASRSKILRC